MMESAKMKLRLRKRSSSGKASQPVTTEASPDSKCPICLDRFNNMAYLDRCLHKFCFRCIHEWSKNKAECPLCKQAFNSIFHTIKAENDFKEFVLRPTENGSFGSPGGHRFRYRTTLTRERREAQQQQEQRRQGRRTSPPPDNGVIFEGLGGTAPPPQPDRGLRRMVQRLAARRRAQSEGRTLRRLREQEVVRFRRALYRNGVRVRSVRDGGRYRDTSAEFYRRNPACLHRLVPWLKRELTVLYGAHGSLVNIVQHIIMTWITRYDMEDGAMQEELRPFLLARTDHFLHEFISFARSPFNMEAYDQHAVYDCPAPSSLEEDSSSDASVIAISEDEDDGADSTGLERGPGSTLGAGLGQAPWDDETPGPSYSTTEQAMPLPLVVSESESESSAEEAGGPGAAPQPGAQVKTDPSANKSEDASSSEEDCVIVGYVKPMAERTPELVQLSSDSEESVHDKSPEIPKQPQHIRFPSLSPRSSTGSLASKHKSPPRQEHSGRSEVNDRDQISAVDKDRRPPSPWGSPPPDRHRTSRVRDKRSGKHSKSDKRTYSDSDGRRHRKWDGSRERSRSKECARDRRRRSRSTERSRSARSPTISVNSDSTVSRSRGRSRSRSRDRWPSRDEAREKRWDRDGRSGRSCENYSHSYHRVSYSYYSRERESGYTVHNQSRSHYTSHYGISSRWTPSRSCSRSRSRTPTRSHHRERRRSRSPSSTSSVSAHQRPRHEKPSGKRKYKTRHLEASSRDRSSPPAASSSSAPCPKEKRRERRHKTSRRKSRSPSVEIVYEGQASGEGRRHHKKKKKKHKKKSRRRKSREGAERRSPTVITINSDSEHGPDPEGPADHETHSDFEAPTDLESPADPKMPSDPETPADPEVPADLEVSNPTSTGLLDSILHDWEGQVLPVRQDGHADTLNTEAASTADVSDKKGEVPHGESGQTPVSSKEETNTGSPPKKTVSGVNCLLDNSSDGVMG